jgi:transcription antitermination factor NusG
VSVRRSLLNRQLRSMWIGLTAWWGEDGMKGLAGRRFAKSARRSHANFEGKREPSVSLCSPSLGIAFTLTKKRLPVSQQAIDRSFGVKTPFLNPATMDVSCARKWYAVFTVPQNEKSAVKHLDLREIDSFLPTYETVRVWKNRQRVKLVLPLFPRYLFVHINPGERAKVFQSPGVLHIVGNGREYVPLPDREIEFLRSASGRQQIEPYRELVVGEKVRIKSGAMQGVCGTLVRKGGGMRFVLTLELINQHAAVQVDAEDLEPFVA